jgi:hypothetical protein
MAVIIGRGAVTFLGWVRLGPADGAWTPGSISTLLANPTSLQGRLVVVDGWLTGYGGAISCPLAGDEAYGCGDAAWITTQRYVSTWTSSNAVAVYPPSDGIRVQNGAYEAFAPASSAGVAPHHGLYLIDAVGPVVSCFDCTSTGGVGRLVARIDPIAFPGSQTASPPSQEPVASSPASPDAGSWYMDQEELVASVRQARLGIGVGRVVVADVTFGLGGDCRGSANPPYCYAVIAGADPPIQLRDARRDCPPTWYCAFIRNPIVPGGGPFVLKILGDGSVSFVDYLATPASPSSPGWPAWSFDELRVRLGRLDGSRFDDYQAYLVSGWISGAAGIPRCLYQPGADPRFDCGQAAWLTADPAQPNAFPTDGWPLTTPTNSIRLQNGAYADFAPSPTPRGPATAPEPEFGTFLVKAVLPAPGCVFCDGPVAEVIARLDPP